jgi:hypothetical protein
MIKNYLSTPKEYVSNEKEPKILMKAAHGINGLDLKL